MIPRIWSRVTFFGFLLFGLKINRFEQNIPIPPILAYYYLLPDIKQAQDQTVISVEVWISSRVHLVPQFPYPCKQRSRKARGIFEGLNFSLKETIKQDTV